MDGLNTFTFEGRSAVRTVEVGSNPTPHFVAKDVVLALDTQWWGAKTIAHVPAKWKGVGSVPTPYGNPKVLTLSEEGLYFYVCRSDKPKARPFQEWLSGEVLPMIRKTGTYSTEKPAAQPELTDLPTMTKASDWYVLIETYLEQYAKGCSKFEQNAREVWGIGKGPEEERRFGWYRTRLRTSLRSGYVRVGDYFMCLGNGWANNPTIHFMHESNNWN